MEELTDTMLNTEWRIEAVKNLDQKMNGYSLVAVQISKASFASLRFDGLQTVLQGDNLCSDLWIFTACGLPIDFISFAPYVTTDGVITNYLLIRRQQEISITGEYWARKWSCSPDNYVHIFLGSVTVENKAFDSIFRQMQVNNRDVQVDQPASTEELLWHHGLRNYIGGFVLGGLSMYVAQSMYSLMIKKV